MSTPSTTLFIIALLSPLVALCAGAGWGETSVSCREPGRFPVLHLVRDLEPGQALTASDVRTICTDEAFVMSTSHLSALPAGAEAKARMFAGEPLRKERLSMPTDGVELPVHRLVEPTVLTEDTHLFFIAADDIAAGHQIGEGDLFGLLVPIGGEVWLGCEEGAACLERAEDLIGRQAREPILQNEAVREGRLGP